MKKHNFYAGPSILSEYTIKNTAAAVENFAGMGLSLLEISHRSKPLIWIPAHGLRTLSRKLSCLGR